MKRKLISAFLAFSLLLGSAVTLSSCTGPAGESGPQGPEGPQGPSGNPGEDGEDGSVWLTGKGAPSTDLGVDNDIYLDVDTYDLYQKLDGTWQKIGNISGEDGDTGKPGSTWLTGKGAPSNEIGSNGDMYLDTDTYDLYQKANDAWAKLGNIGGNDGDTAYSNTILPSANGYVTVDKGSASVGENVTFTMKGMGDYSLSSIKLNGAECISDVKPGADNSVTLTKPMVENGFVVEATFDIIQTTNYFKDGKLYENGKIASDGTIISEGTLNKDVAFSDGTGTAEDPLLISSVAEWKMITGDFLSKFKESGFYYKVTTNLDFTNETKVTIDEFSGTIDFDNHYITGVTSKNTDKGTFITNNGDKYYNGYKSFITNINGESTIKNLNFIFDSKDAGYIVLSSLAYNANLTYENINLYGSVSFDDDSRYAPLLDSVAGDSSVTFKNCNNYMNIDGQKRVSAFFAVIDNNPSTNISSMTFDNCHFYGIMNAYGPSAVSEEEHASLLIADGLNIYQGERITEEDIAQDPDLARLNLHVDDLHITNCSNRGMIMSDKFDASKNNLVAFKKSFADERIADFVKKQNDCNVISEENAYFGKDFINRGGYSMYEKFTSSKKMSEEIMAFSNTTNVKVILTGLFTDNLETPTSYETHSITMSFTKEEYEASELMTNNWIAYNETESPNYTEKTIGGLTLKIDQNNNYVFIYEKDGKQYYLVANTCKGVVVQTDTNNQYTRITPFYSEIK